MITQYDLLSMTESVVRMMERNNIDVKDVRYIALYEDFVRLKGEGHKVGYIVYYLSEQYECSEATIYRVIKRMAKEIE